MNIDKDIEEYFDIKKMPLQDIIRLFKREGIENFVIAKREKFEKVLSELEKYKNVTYFEKLEDGKLYQIDKERADDLYKHGNGNWLYIQMWKRNED